MSQYRKDHILGQVKHLLGMGMRTEDHANTITTENTTIQTENTHNPIEDTILTTHNHERYNRPIGGGGNGMQKDQKGISYQCM